MCDQRDGRPELVVPRGEHSRCRADGWLWCVAIVMVGARAAFMRKRWKNVGSHRTLPAADCSERVFGVPQLDAVDDDSNVARQLRDNASVKESLVKEA